MRRLAMLLAVAGLTLPAYGAKRTTVGELEQTIAAAHGLPDAEAARKLSDLELTERLSRARLVRLEQSLPGEQARKALLILADQSVFLDLPAEEISKQAAPDVATQRKIMALTVNYISQTVHQLPNLFATRVTTSFEDMPAVQKPGAITTSGATTGSAYQPIHQVGQSTVTVTFRDGREVVEKSALKSQERTLSTAGVFGPILGTVLVDAARSKLAWSRWEQDGAGLEAVFGFAVPKEKSHYSITYDSVPTEPGPCSTTPQSFSEVVAYHGEMVVDPASGAIVRLILQADMKPGQFTDRSDIEVEYGHVDIGGKSYVLPVRSVSSTVAHALFIFEGDCPRLDETLSLQRSVNDVVFRDYHVFRADATILTDSEAAKLEQQALAPSEGGAKQNEKANDLPPATTATENSAPSSNAQSAPSASSDAAASGASSGSTVSSPTGAAASTREMNSVGGGSSLPAATATAGANSAMEAEQESVLREMPVLRTNARDVVLDVVVTKSNGDPVPGLTKEDFHVEEDGKPQAIDFLEEHTAASSPREEPQSLPKLPQGTYTNAQPAPAGDAVNVLLLDTLNTPQQDQVFVHSEIRDFLKKMQPGTRVAIFALGSKLRYIQGFTTDTTVLAAALNDKTKGALPVKQSRDSGDAADNAADVERLTMMQSMGAGYLAAALADASSFDQGKRTAMTFEALDHLALYLAGIPGRKNLIWFSSSFPVVIFPSAELRAKLAKLPGLQKETQKTADMFTASQISIYPVSAEGMMVEHVGEAASAGPGVSDVNGHFGNVADGAASNGTMSPFMGGAAERASAVTAMQQLAASTGGKAYYNTNDLSGALMHAINDGAHYYTLSYSPANAKMDGTYRDIEIHLTKGHYTLAYRHGYNADDSSSLEPTSGTDPMAPVMKLGLPGATGILYGVRVAPMKPQPLPDAARAGQNSKLGGTTVRYGVDFFIRLADVALQVDSKGEHNGRIEVGLMAYGQDGSAVNWDRVTQAINLQPAAYGAMQKSGIPVHMELDLPVEPVYLLTGVYDWGGAKTGSLEIPLEAGSSAAASAVR